MDRYAVKFIVCGDNNGDGPDGAEYEYQTNVTANSELMARRLILEKAWGLQLLVSGFISIERKIAK